MKLKKGDKVEFIRDYGDIEKGRRGRYEGEIIGMSSIHLNEGGIIACLINGARYLKLVEDVDKREQAIYARMAKVKRPKPKKFKVGVKVRIKGDLEVGKIYNSNTEMDNAMMKYLGKVTTISKVGDDEDGIYYKLDINWSWSKDMLEIVEV